MSRRFASEAERAGAKVTTDLRPGGHEWGLWDAVIRDVIDWLPLRRS
jgi:putative tributyrin esterase